MARKKSVQIASAVPGYTFWLDRKLGAYEVRDLTKRIEALGGSVQSSINAQLDYLVLAEERRGTPGRSQAERDLAKVPNAHAIILYGKEATQLVCPSREEALDFLSRGPHTREEWMGILPRSHSGVKIDLRRADLRGLDLSRYYIWSCDLEGADLEGTILTDAYVSGVTGVDFRRIGDHHNFRFNEVTDCNFDGLNLSARFVHGAIIRCTFRGANLEKWSVWGTGSQDVDLTEARCTGADFKNWGVTGLVGERANFSCTRLRNVQWVGARLAGTRFADANLEEIDLSGADLSGCDFHRANLARANLSGANLSGANLIQANLGETNLTDANVTGADFTGANLRGTKLTRVNRKEAKGLTPTRGTVAGPLLTQLVADLAATKEWHLHFTLTDSDNGVHRYQLHRHPNAKSCSLRTENAQGGNYSYPLVADMALLDLAKLLPGATLQLDTIKLRPARLGKDLERLALQALCEVFGQTIPDATEVQKAKKASRQGATAHRNALVTELRQGSEAIHTWNARPAVEREVLGQLEGVDLSRVNLAGIDLEKSKLSGANFQKSDLHGANFASAALRSTDFSGANLRQAKFDYATASEVNFEGADLSEAELYWVGFRKANFRNANLRGANLRRARLQGADLTGADLADVSLLATEYDATTKFPAKYRPGVGWKRTGKAPAPVRAVVAPPPKQDLDFAAFVTRVRGLVDNGRFHNALDMLQAEKFSLFAQASEMQVVGVVRSQSSKERVYACRLTNQGEFECGTQNLRPCGGLRGSVCKHLLVLILGLTRSGTLDPGTAHQWLQMANRQGPTFDKDAMTATFLRYQGAATGEVDWRPTETVPEDYYAL